jgi:hypothetical protein
MRASPHRWAAAVRALGETMRAEEAVASKLIILAQASVGIRTFAESNRGVLTTGHITPNSLRNTHGRDGFVMLARVMHPAQHVCRQQKQIAQSSKYLLTWAVVLDLIRWSMIQTAFIRRASRA